MKILHLFVVVFACLASALHAQSGLTRLGEFKVNTTTSGDQFDPRMAVDAAGNFVVVWTSADSSGSGIFAQRYNPACAPVGSEFQVNPAPGTNDQRNPSVSMAPDGRFVIVWEAANPAVENLPTGIRGRLYDANGTPQIDFDGSPGRAAGHPSVAMDASGRFVVAWDESNYQLGRAWALRFSAVGTPVGSIFQMHPGYNPANERPSVSTNASGDFVIAWYADVPENQAVFARGYFADGTTKFDVARVSPVEQAIHQLPSVAMRADGSFIVAWQEATGLDGSGYGIYRRRFDASGNALDPAKVLVNTATAGEQSAGSVSVGPSGEFVVGYRSMGFDGSAEAVTAQRFDANGTKVGSEFFANTFTAGAQTCIYNNGANAIDAQGNLIFVWQSAAQDGSGLGIYADKFYLPNQGPPLTEFRVNTTTTGDQQSASVACAPDGRSVVAWTNAADNSIYFQRYGSAGLRVGTESKANTASAILSGPPSVAMDQTGNFIVTWVKGGDGDGWGIAAQRFNSNGEPIGIGGTIGPAEFNVNTQTQYDQSTQDVAMATDGRFAICWHTYFYPESLYRSYVQFYNANGSAVGGQVQLNPATLYDSTPAIAARPGGGFGVVWRQSSAGNDDIKLRLFSADGTPEQSGNILPVAEGLQNSPAIAFAPDGSIVVAFMTSGGDASGNAIFAQRLTAAGSKVGSRFLVNNAQGGDQANPCVVFDSASTFVVGYRSAGFDGNGNAFAARGFNYADASEATPEFLVNTFTTGNQNPLDLEHTIAADSVGNLVFAWESDNQDGSIGGIYGRKIFRYPVATVTTQAASPVTDTGAKLNGTVNAHGDTASVSIEYADTPTFTGAVTGGVHDLGVVTGTSDTPVSTMLSGLSPGQTIYFRVRAISSGREVVGQTLSFTTKVLVPTVTSPVQTARTATTASLDVMVNPKGAATTVLLEYSLNPGGPFTPTTAQNCGGGLADVVKTFNLSGLTASSTYTVRAKATNSAGTTQSADAAFTTTGKPGVTTGGTTDVTKTGATLLGTVNPFGIAATAHFEYGLTTGYGQGTSDQPVGSGDTATVLQTAISGLEPNKTYHYRLVGTNAAGTTNGADMSFSTAADPPVAVTAAPANVMNTSATLNGAVIPLSRSTDAYFEWGTTALYGNVTPTQTLPAGSTAVNLEAMLTGLSSGGTYHYRMVATNSGGTAVGDDQPFVAMNGGGGSGATAAPTVVTGVTTGRTSTTATLQGTVNPNGGTTTAYFEYGETTSYGATTTPQNAGNGASPVNASAPVGGLTPAKTYHFRLVAINELGTTNGDDATFTTEPPLAPIVQSGSAPDPTQTGATLSGKVNPNGGDTTARFEYGLTTAYGSLTAAQNIGSGTSLVDVMATLSGLTAGTSYHFRLIATNAGGTTNGPDGTFTTAPPAPTVTNSAPSPIGATFATLRAKVHPHGKATTAYIEYGTNNSYGTAKPVQNLGSGDADVDLSEPLTGLIAGTTYHFRVVATSSQGTTNGDDATFTMLPAQDPEAVSDFLFVGSLVTPASRNLLANDVNHDYPPTTNLDLSFAELLSDRQPPVVAQGSVVREGSVSVTYTRFATFRFDTANFPPNPSDIFGYRITTPAGKTADGQVNVYHFGSFKGSFGGVISGGTQEDGGAIALELASSGDFTMKLTWQGIDYSSKPQLNGAGQLASVTGTLPIPKRNSAVPGKNLVLKLQLQPDGRIPGTLEDQETQKTFTFTLRRAGLATDEDPKAQQFTATMDQLPLALAEGAPLSENAPRGGITPQQVTGFGFYLAKLSKARNKLNARFTGGMPDQAKISSGSKVFGDRVLLNQRLYQKGRLFGGRVFGESTLVRRASFTSTLEWIKKTNGLFGPPPPSVGPRVLPFDFHNALSLAGDSYQKTGDLPPAQRFIMDFGSTLEVRFSAGGLAAEQTALFTLRQSGAGFKVIVGDTTLAKKPTFKVNAATGMFSGTFVHPDSQRYKKPLKFSGAFRRNPDASYDVNEKGRGSFLGFDNAGFVRVFKGAQ
jgi:phosphodiesterase/alkaline phosphatase D-like protein